MKYSKWVMQSYFKELAFTRSLLNITAWNWTYALKKVLAFQSSCMSSDAPPCQALSPFFTTSEQLYCSVILSFRFGSTSFCFDKADIAALKGSTCMHLVLKVLFFLVKKANSWNDQNPMSNEEFIGAKQYKNPNENYSRKGEALHGGITIFLICC